MNAGDLGWWGVAIAILGGAIRVSTPYLFVSLAETLTEKSGRVNLGLEGTLLMGAMSGYGVSYLSGSPWLGLAAAAAAGTLFGLLHAMVCNLPRVNDVAVGIALFIFGNGLAFFLGKPFVQPQAPRLPTFDLGSFSSVPAVRAALDVSPLFFAGIGCALLMRWALVNTRWGLIVRAVGDNSLAARAAGYPVNLTRTLATAAGGALTGIAGAFLSLSYPGTWAEGLSSGQGLMAVTLVIFARWKPVNCVWVSLLFGGASALGPALQIVGVSGYYYLIGAAPYVLTLGLLIASSSRRQQLAGAPGELSINR
ncbi:ABC transporter permease [Lacisediminimonas sp.]|uniref:ABC transporter permease n=1 Tax=Lacisediminimonas sp. TaxID=3060582 RepID=UPI00271B3CF0|nr:ABC transporter permease [Lacisediminimonas sp.]MDO8299559.1 ABC transporter permease [Lacisediminimonas sp.]